MNLTSNFQAMTDIKNIVNGTNIKCTFNIASLNVTTEAGLRSAADTTFRLVVGSGTERKSTNTYVYTFFFLCV